MGCRIVRKGCPIVTYVLNHVNPIFWAGLFWVSGNVRLCAGPRRAVGYDLKGRRRLPLVVAYIASGFPRATNICDGETPCRPWANVMSCILQVMRKHMSHVGGKRAVRFWIRTLNGGHSVRLRRPKLFTIADRQLSDGNPGNRPFTHLIIAQLPSLSLGFMASTSHHHAKQAVDLSSLRSRINEG